LSLITASNLSKSFGPDDVFSGITFSIPPRARIAIVGANGIGKTTLLRILAGEDSPSDGLVTRARNITIGYLQQEAVFLSDHSLWEESLRAMQHLRETEARLAEMEEEISANPRDTALLERYGKTQAAFELQGGYTYETRIRQTLTGLGFSKDEYRMPLRYLSGGQRTRALLAHLLLSDPDLLILDEPTNHLDINAVEWLEGYLRAWDGAALIVSHDRYFLDRVVDRIWEMRFGGLEEYRGNYSAYVQERHARWEERVQFVRRERERMEKEMDYIVRHIAGQRTQQAKGKLSRLSRQIRAIEQHGFEGIKGKKWSEIGQAANPMTVDEAMQRMRALRSPEETRPLQVGMRIRAQDRSGNYILLAEEANIGYPGNCLFTIEELELKRLECAALIGPNGAGKTTFLRTLTRDLVPLGGKLKQGANLKIGYFAQAHEDLDSSLTLIEEIERVSSMLPNEIRSYLGRYMFSGDEHYKKVSVLSGGERGRLALAKLALSDANFLLLDEPTNHLDIPAQEVLQNVLAEYNGTIILVSHDRYLIDALATQIWEIDTQTGELKVFKGTYSQYRAEKEGQSRSISRKESISRSSKMPVATKSKRKPKGKTEMSKHERRRLEARISTIEEDIAKLELKLVELGRQLQIPTDNPAELQRLGEEYAYTERDLEEAMEKWEELHLE
jgi:ATP-binding cassette subfamily F protein 3